MRKISRMHIKQIRKYTNALPDFQGLRHSFDFWHTLNFLHIFFSDKIICGSQSIKYILEIDSRSQKQWVISLEIKLDFRLNKDIF